MNTVLARLVNLAQAALEAGSQEKAGHIIVNRIHSLVKTERAVLVPLKEKTRVLCVSGDIEASEDNPFSQAVHEIRKFCKGGNEPRVISGETLPDDIRATNARQILAGMGGTHILWMPLPLKADGDAEFALWMERWGGNPWTQEEIRMVSHARTFLAHALIAREKKVEKGSLKMQIPLIFLVLLLFVPITGRINAPAQVVPNRPHYVFAPFDGIIEELLVRPGEKVHKDDVLFRYDTRVLEKQLEEARSGLGVARAELARLEGAAYMDEESRARIPVQKLEVERRQAEVDFLKEQLALSEVRAEEDGIVVLDDPDSLVGAPVFTGKLVLSVADPNRTKLRILSPVTDAGLIREGAPVVMRPDTDPFSSMHGKVTHVGFDVIMSEERIPSILIEAEWDEDMYIRPGQRGAAKIEGPKMPLGILFLRKQIGWIRKLFGI